MIILKAIQLVIRKPGFRNSFNITRNMAGHDNVIKLQSSRFQWLKFKDLMNLYLIIGVIPMTVITVFANVFVGPATLKQIPKDYVPNYWEYYSNPITRFIARYILTNPQQEYEKFLHHLYEDDERARIRAVESKILQLMSERNDYQAYYYRPVLTKYHRLSKQTSDKLKQLQSD